MVGLSIDTACVPCYAETWTVALVRGQVCVLDQTCCVIAGLH